MVGLLIFDEAQAIRKVYTNSFWLIYKLAARFNLLLTATPMEFGIKDLMVLLQLVLKPHQAGWKNLEERLKNDNRFCSTRSLWGTHWTTSLTSLP
ncbi:hypothetical protein DPV78_003946 [Talaromyces pinophilus]|nr:hypothetical protein DPV78_003946 [Talaromyces pinophilus]